MTQVDRCERSFADSRLSFAPFFFSLSLHSPRTQAAILESLGILKDELDGWYARLDDVCGTGGFPPIQKWSNAESDAEIGMQVFSI